MSDLSKFLSIPLTRKTSTDHFEIKDEFTSNYSKAKYEQDQLQIVELNSTADKLRTTIKFIKQQRQGLEVRNKSFIDFQKHRIQQSKLNNPGIEVPAASQNQSIAQNYDQATLSLFAKIPQNVARKLQKTLIKDLPSYDQQYRAYARLEEEQKQRLYEQIHQKHLEFQKRSIENNSTLVEETQQTTKNSPTHRKSLTSLPQFNKIKSLKMSNQFQSHDEKIIPLKNLPIKGLKDGVEFENTTSNFLAAQYYQNKNLLHSSKSQNKIPVPGSPSKIATMRSGQTFTDFAMTNKNQLQKLQRDASSKSQVGFGISYLPTNHSVSLLKQNASQINFSKVIDQSPDHKTTQHFQRRQSYYQRRQQYKSVHGGTVYQTSIREQSGFDPIQETMKKINKKTPLNNRRMLTRQNTRKQFQSMMIREDQSSEDSFNEQYSKKVSEFDSPKVQLFQFGNQPDKMIKVQSVSVLEPEQNQKEQNDQQVNQPSEIDQTVKIFDEPIQDQNHSNSKVSHNRPSFLYRQQRILGKIPSNFKTFIRNTQKVSELLSQCKNANNL
ncbi:UNKNOWN [Stylonychia lemnae]|uniref:Uncharacterized protein n=1 Tax=Stylonychia lemnae TaxID=5949 RepID=A0A078AXJ2_STYLE|nr:UNKNOWN [Stylonychia lemnae]|eukprot:CDW86791.1 UNKNOWN [Stylonychia lemnae]